MELNEILAQQPILLFDGECGFCNKSIQFILKHESKPKLKFAPLQSNVGQQLLTYFEIDAKKIDSIILIRGNQAFIKSCAALRVTQYLKALWPGLMAFIIVPPFIRNLVYDWIAKRRMKWFGRVESCSLLQKEDRKRFLDL